MKHKRLFIIAVAAAVLGAAACTGLEESEGLQNFTMSLEISPESETVIAEGGSVSFSFNAPDYWFANCPADWVSVEPASGKPGDNTITVTAIQNTGAERTAVITVTAKTQKGQCSITQSAWPYSAAWSISDGISAAMADQGDKLVWKAEKVPSHVGESFSFSMAGGSDKLGLDGSLSASGSVYSGKLKKGGSKIALPENGYWDITLDLNDWTVSAELVDRFNWSMVGTINGGSWDDEIGMFGDEAKLVWSLSKVPYISGQAFKFRMDSKEAYTYGLDGAFVADGDAYKASIKLGGSEITLPSDGLWNIKLDLNDNSVTAEFAGDLPSTKGGILWEAGDAAPVAVSWNGVYRIGLNGTDPNNECLVTLTEDTWAMVKSETIYVVFKPNGDYYQIRVTNGWWDADWKGSVVEPGSELISANGDGTFTLKLNVSDDPDFVASLDQKHLLLTGDGYTPQCIYLPEVFWEAGEETPKAVSWSSDYRFGLQGRDGNNECMLTFPEKAWNKIKTQTFYLLVQGASPSVRVTTGWWDPNWNNGDIQPGSALIADNGDGTWTVTINLTNDPDFVAALDERHILFTGDGYTPLRWYIMK